MLFALVVGAQAATWDVGGCAQCVAQSPGAFLAGPTPQDGDIIVVHPHVAGPPIDVGVNVTLRPVAPGLVLTTSNGPVLEIHADVTLDPGFVIDAQGLHRGVRVSDGTLTASGLTIRDGSGSQGALLRVDPSAAVSLEASTLERSTGSGDAVLIRGGAGLDGLTVTDASTGAVTLVVEGLVTLSDSTFATQSSAPAVELGGSGELAVTTTSFFGTNASVAIEGGNHLVSLGDVWIEGYYDGVAVDDLTVTSSTIRGLASGTGNGLECDTCTITGTVIEGFRSNVRSFAEVTFVDSASCNTWGGSQGGGLYTSGSAIVRQALFAGNAASSGGAIYNAGDLDVTYTTFVANDATNSGSVVYSASEGTVGSSVLVDNDSQLFTGFSNVDTIVSESLYWPANPSFGAGFDDGGGNAGQDPGFSAWMQGDACDAALFWPTAGSPAIDGGDSSVLDPDGGPSDAGLTGGWPVYGEGPWVDADGDLVPLYLDCDDADPTVGNAELWYLDTDADGYGTLDGFMNACGQPSGYAANPSDCAPDDPALPVQIYADVDADGYGDDGSATTTCTPSASDLTVGGDCDDDNAAVSPAAAETCDGVDDDCNGAVDDGLPEIESWPDLDGDGYGDASLPSTLACGVPSGNVTDGTDCDDTLFDVNPGAIEACDGVDNDCDGDADTGAGSEWYADDDGDGFGAGDAVVACADVAGRVENGDDCDDTDASVSPGGTEVCNGRDDDCDAQIDDDDADLDVSTAATWWADEDGDGTGGDDSIEACEAPSGYVETSGDCDDADATVAADCSGTPDETPDDNKIGVGCGCASRSGLSGLTPLFGLALLALRRRRAP